MSYEFGDWVVYYPGYGDEIIGRVVDVHEESETAFVCYTKGCTAARTPLEFLRRARYSEIVKAPAGIGFHRFDATCPKRDEDVCAHCKAAMRS